MPSSSSPNEPEESLLRVRALLEDPRATPEDVTAHILGLKKARSFYPEARLTTAVFVAEAIQDALIGPRFLLLLKLLLAERIVEPSGCLRCLEEVLKTTTVKKSTSSAANIEFADVNIEDGSAVVGAPLNTNEGAMRSRRPHSDYEVNADEDQAVEKEKREVYAQILDVVFQVCGSQTLVLPTHVKRLAGTFRKEFPRFAQNLIAPPPNPRPPNPRPSTSGSVRAPPLSVVPGASSAAASSSGVVGTSSKPTLILSTSGARSVDSARLVAESAPMCLPLAKMDFDAIEQPPPQGFFATAEDLAVHMTATPESEHMLARLATLSSKKAALSKTGSYGATKAHIKKKALQKSGIKTARTQMSLFPPGSASREKEAEEQERELEQIEMEKLSIAESRVLQQLGQQQHTAENFPIFSIAYLDEETLFCGTNNALCRFDVTDNSCTDWIWTATDRSGNGISVSPSAPTPSSSSSSSGTSSRVGGTCERIVSLSHNRLGDRVCAGSMTQMLGTSNAVSVRGSWVQLWKDSDGVWQVDSSTEQFKRVSRSCFLGDAVCLSVTTVEEHAVLVQGEAGGMRGVRKFPLLSAAADLVAVDPFCFAAVTRAPSASLLLFDIRQKAESATQFSLSQTDLTCVASVDLPVGTEGIATSTAILCAGDGLFHFDRRNMLSGPVAGRELIGTAFRMHGIRRRNFCALLDSSGVYTANVSDGIMSLVLSAEARTSNPEELTFARQAPTCYDLTTGGDSVFVSNKLGVEHYRTEVLPAPVVY